MVTPKCEKAAADECTTTAATISVNVVMGPPLRFQLPLLYGRPRERGSVPNVKCLSSGDGNHRRQRDDDDAQPSAEAAPQADAPAFDPASLPPAISARKSAKPAPAADNADAPVASDDAEAPAKPKRRTRRAASAEDGATAETVN